MKSILRKIAVAVVFVGVLACFGVVAYFISQQEERDIKKLLFNEEGKIAQALFSPDDDLRSVLISLMKHEKKRIRLAIYTLTDKEIAQALISAHGRGVVVECVVDPGYGSDRYSKVYQLANGRIPVWVYQSSKELRNESLMHNKFCIFDDTIEHRSVIWTGSYNFTARANERNQENIVVLENRRIVERFESQFEILKKRSIQING